MQGFIAAAFIFTAIALAGMSWEIGATTGRLMVYWVAG